MKITFGRVVRLTDMYIQPYNKSITFSNYAENNSLSTELIHYYGRKIHLHSVHSHTNKLKLSDLLHTWTVCGLYKSPDRYQCQKREILKILKKCDWQRRNTVHNLPLTCLNKKCTATLRIEYL